MRKPSLATGSVAGTASLGSGSDIGSPRWPSAASRSMIAWRSAVLGANSEGAAGQPAQDAHPRKLWGFGILIAVQPPMDHERLTKVVPQQSGPGSDEGEAAMLERIGFDREHFYFK